MIKNKYILLSVGIICYLISSCTSSSKPINKDTMANIIMDLYIAESMVNVSGADNLRDQRENIDRGIYVKYNISEEIFKTSLRWYADNIKDYMQINDTVVERLKRNQKVINDFRDSEMKLLYNYAEQITKPLKTHLTPDNKHLSFEFDSMRIQRMKQDELEGFHWNFSILGLKDKEELSLNLSFIYTDTSIYTFDTLITDTHNYLIPKPTNRPDSLLRTITGYLNLLNPSLTSNAIVYDIEYKDPKIEVWNDSLAIESY